MAFHYWTILYNRITGLENKLQGNPIKNWYHEKRNGFSTLRGFDHKNIVSINPYIEI